MHDMGYGSLQKHPLAKPTKITCYFCSHFGALSGARNFNAQLRTYQRQATRPATSTLQERGAIISIVHADNTLQRVARKVSSNKRFISVAVVDLLQNIAKKNGSRATPNQSN